MLGVADPRERAARLRLMAFDVDGVLTDGSLYYGDGGAEIKAFSSIDGLGLNLLKKAGVELAIITGRSVPCVAERAKHLQIRHLHQGASDKLATLRALTDELGFSLGETGFMGDDVIDIRAMAACGFAATTADSRNRIKIHAHWVSRYPGGRGAVREVCDFILDAKGMLDAVLAPYLPEIPG
ncbi:MAG: phenylphosphate carboxylase subunit delta [Candidatus Accumulibacter sp.]|jgi:3-deoxy-D-manno-octulosonate 8-phosphate phosphatase (KDO 8-P phosphatase)|nr:phenylphosphate carboxylase subunit delta [Accumulibacter sp.]